MNVEILNPEILQDLYKNHGIFACTCYDTPDKYAEKVGKSCQDSGHYSGSRTEYIKFKISGTDRGCYDEETEVLTNEGWKFFKDIKQDEILATRNTENGMVEYHKIDKKLEFDVNETMHYYKGNAVDLLVTDDHNMYVKSLYNKDDNGFDLVSSKNISVKRINMNKEFNYDVKIEDNINIKGYKYYANNNKMELIEKSTSDFNCKRNLFYKFLAWYLSDGSIYYNKNDNKYTITITQTDCDANLKNKTKERIMNIIKDMGFKPFSDKKRIRFVSATLGRFLKKTGISHNKFIPLDILSDFNKKYAKIFIDEYFKGDGYLYKIGKNGKLFTSSKKLADELQLVSYIAGYTSKMYKYDGKENVIVMGTVVSKTKDRYIINVSLGKTNRKPVFNIKNRVLKKYKGKVYCATVKNHIMFIRRNGTCVWCGNTLEQIMRTEIGARKDNIEDAIWMEQNLDLNPSTMVKNMKSFRYVDMGEFEYVTPEIIKKSEKAKEIYKNHMKKTCECISEIKSILEDEFPNTNKKTILEASQFPLPRATATTLVLGVTPETLIRYMWKRLCVRTQPEHRKLANLMVSKVIKILPEFKDKLVPHCQHLLWCPEGNMCCGAYPTRSELLNKLS